MSALASEKILLIGAAIASCRRRWRSIGARICQAVPSYFDAIAT